MVQSEKAPFNCVLVMPAYNEEACIESVLKEWAKALRETIGPSFRMIVVNDGSKDKTGALLDGLAKELPELTPIHQKNGGHGVALMTAYQQAMVLHSDFIFHVDSDDQFKVSDFKKFWSVRSESNFILGWRKIRHDAFHRLVITSILKVFLFLCFGVWIQDSNIPYRLIKTTYLRVLIANLPKNIFAPNIFLSVLAAKDGQNLMSIPVHHEDRKTGTVSIVRWKLIEVCFRCIGELIEFRVSLGRKMNAIRAATAKV